MGFNYSIQFIDIVTLPQHCQMYPLPFDRMNGLVFMIWTAYRILMKFMGSSDCPNHEKTHCQNTNKHVCMEMVLAESSMLVGCSYIPSQMMIRYETYSGVS